MKPGTIRWLDVWSSPRVTPNPVLEKPECTSRQQGSSATGFVLHRLGASTLCPGCPAPCALCPVPCTLTCCTLFSTCAQTPGLRRHLHPLGGSSSLSARSSASSSFLPQDSDVDCRPHPHSLQPLHRLLRNHRSPTPSTLRCSGRSCSPALTQACSGLKRASPLRRCPLFSALIPIRTDAGEVFFLRTQRAMLLSRPASPRLLGSRPARPRHRGLQGHAHGYALRDPGDRRRHSLLGDWADTPAPPEPAQSANRTPDGRLHRRIFTIVAAFATHETDRCRTFR